MVHCVPRDENPYSHCNSVCLSKEMDLPFTHYFTTPISLEKPLIAKIGRGITYLNSLEEEYTINRGLSNDLEINNDSTPKKEPTPQER